MALSVALQAAGEEAVDYSIFCSQHGEIVRTRKILSSIVAGEEISPTAFAQSVHNTASGLYTILEKSHAASTSIASGPNSFAYAWIEAHAWLASNPEHRVLLVDFDEVIPAEYQGDSGQVACDHALALVLRAAGSGGIGLSPAEPDSDSGLPLGPRFLAWLQGGEERLVLGSEGRGWQWAR